MNYILIIAFLLVFFYIAYVLGYHVGFKKGANKVIDEWRNWIDQIEGE